MNNYETMQFMIKSVNPAIDEDVVKLAVLHMENLQQTVMEGGQNLPEVFFIKQGKVGLMATEFLDKFNGKDKDQFAKMLNNLRGDCDAVLLAIEAWTSKAKKGDKLIAPRKDPNREETLLVQVYIKGRTLMFSAPITRNPTAIGDWALRFDTAKEGDRIEGRFA